MQEAAPQQSASDGIYAEEINEPTPGNTIEPPGERLHRYYVVDNTEQETQDRLRAEVAAARDAQRRRDNQVPLLTVTGDEEEWNGSEAQEQQEGKTPQVEVKAVNELKEAAVVGEPEGESNAPREQHR